MPFTNPATLRSGQQAALAHDLRSLIGVLGLSRPIVAGFDWGGRAACLTAALWPETVAGLVTVNGAWENVFRFSTPAGGVVTAVVDGFTFLYDANGNIIMRVFHGSVSAGNNVKG